MQKEKLYYPALDAIRSIACIFVLVSHIFYNAFQSYLHTRLSLLEPAIKFFLANGGFGVHMFFVLSGFLISFLLLTEKIKYQKLHLGKFYLRRILRIWPVYFAVIFFGFVCYPLLKLLFHQPITGNEKLGYYIFFIGNFDVIRIEELGRSLNSMLDITWSVSIEEQFYLIWPWFFFLLGGRSLFWAVFGVMLTSVAFLLFHHMSDSAFYHHTLSNFLFLSAGGILAFISVYKNESLQRLGQMSKRIQLLTYLLLLFFLIYSVDWLGDTQGGATLYWLLTAISIVWFLFHQLFVRKRVISLENSHFLVSMGKYTYGLYMYHRIAQWVIGQLVERFSLGTTIFVSVLQVILTVLLAFCFSFLSYHFFERRFLRLKEKFAFFVKDSSDFPATSNAASGQRQFVEAP